MSAYACEPGKGSEPEIGWQWALQMARFHDLTVLTRANNQTAIERGLDALRGRQPLPKFFYHDESRFLLGIKRRFRATKLYYLFWQCSAWEIVARLHATHHFDLLHHITLGACRYPAAIWGHGVPCIWGPIGGIECIPIPLLPWSHPQSLLLESCRNVHNFMQASSFHILPRRARASTIILATTPEMRAAFRCHRFDAQVISAVGISALDLPFKSRSSPHNDSVKLLYVGNVIALKGIDLALHALAKSRTSASFTLFGDGNCLPGLRRLAQRLGLEDRVDFRGRVPRQQLLDVYYEFDVFVFPSLHDTGGYAVLEAMFNQLPVICLDCGGPALMVGEGCGIKVRLGGRSNVIHGLAEAIGYYAQDRSRIRPDGLRAREFILQQYDWGAKGEQMNGIYRRAVATSSQAEAPSHGGGGYTGLGFTPKTLHRIVSLLKS